MRRELTTGEDLRRTIRVALAAVTENVDRHLATSPSFQIHDFDGSTWRFVETRSNPDASCACKQGLSHRSFDSLVGFLRDCHFVIASQIGPAAAISLFRQGIRAHVAFGPVEHVLRDFQGSSKIHHPLPKREQETT